MIICTLAVFVVLNINHKLRKERVMKLVIGLSSLSVSRVGEFDEAHLYDEVTHNGQHLQCKGRILAEVRVTGEHTTFSLWHPHTGPETGHVDVFVEYQKGECPTFHQYSHYKPFTPCNRDILGIQESIWPTGGWSLIQVTLAIESFLEQEIGFRPALRNKFFESLAPAPVPA